MTQVCVCASSNPTIHELHVVEELHVRQEAGQELHTLPTWYLFAGQDDRQLPESNIFPVGHAVHPIVDEHSEHKGSHGKQKVETAYCPTGHEKD